MVAIVSQHTSGLVKFFTSSEEPDEGVRRGLGRPPHYEGTSYNLFDDQELQLAACCSRAYRAGSNRPFASASAEFRTGRFHELVRRRATASLAGLPDSNRINRHHRSDPWGVLRRARLLEDYDRYLLQLPAQRLAPPASARPRQ